MDERQTVLERIRATLQPEEGDIAPSPEVAARAVEYIEQAAALAGACGRASVSVDDDGALFVYWRLRPRKLHMKFSAAADKNYLFWMDGNEKSAPYDIDRDFTIERLAYWLKWEQS